LRGLIGLIGLIEDKGTRRRGDKGKWGQGEMGIGGNEDRGKWGKDTGYREIGRRGEMGTGRK